MPEFTAAEVAELREDARTYFAYHTTDTVVVLASECGIFAEFTRETLDTPWSVERTATA